MKTRRMSLHAPPVPDLMEPAPQGQAMQIAARLAARKPSKLVQAVLVVGHGVDWRAWCPLPRGILLPI